MLFLLFFLLIILATAILWALASWFFEFHENFGEIVDYNKAYYSAIAWLERAELVLKYRQPWFQWTGGRLNGTGITEGPENDYRQKFWYYSGMENGGSSWKITSRTTRIPQKWAWNIDWMFLSWDALDYNALKYIDRETFIFDVDDTSGTNAYQTTGSLTSIQVENFSWVIRLPVALSDVLDWLKDSCEDGIGASLGTNPTLCNDAIVSRELDWNSNTCVDSAGSSSFTIFPKVSIFYGDGKIPQIKDDDSAIREDKINSWNIMIFGKNFNPYDSQENGHHTMISQCEQKLSGLKFSELFEASQDLHFKLSLLNLLYSKKNQIYPYLEYYFAFSKDISDRFFTIEVRGKFKNYESKILVKKPTSKESILGSFTVIF